MMNNIQTNPENSLTMEPVVESQEGFHLPPILLQYWHTALRWRWLMAGILAGCLVLGVAATLLMAPL
jgi:uncharacterized protein involved in exopolysaccharide biosynthesis